MAVFFNPSFLLLFCAPFFTTLLCRSGTFSFQFVAMLQDFLTRTFWFLLLLGLQVLVFNHIHIAGYATPMPYFYLLLILPNHTARWVYVGLGFLLGLTVDVFSSTIGEAAATTTFVGLITPLVLNLFAPDDQRDEEFQPSVRTMQWGKFLRYSLLLTLVHTTLFFCLESFSFFHPLNLLLNIGGSTVLTLIFIAAIERIRLSRSPR